MTIPFLCIGAQKAGTTWLYETLSRHPDIWLPPIKELHYFDEIYVPEGHYRARLKSFQNKVNNYIEYLEKPPYKPYDDNTIHKRKEFFELCEFFLIKNDTDYRNYFIRNSGNAKVFGEMTPEYALLPTEGFDRIKSIFPDIHILFIIRDPIARAWSEFRMVANNRGISPTELSDQMKAIPQRSNYGRTIDNVRNSSINNFKVMLYEDLFSEDSLREILTFLNLSPNIPQSMIEMTGRVVHEGKSISAPDEFIGRAREIMRPVHDAVVAEGFMINDKWL